MFLEDFFFSFSQKSKMELKNGLCLRWVPLGQQLPAAPPGIWLMWASLEETAEPRLPSSFLSSAPSPAWLGSPGLEALPPSAKAGADPVPEGGQRRCRDGLSHIQLPGPCVGGLEAMVPQGHPSPWQPSWQQDSCHSTEQKTKLREQARHVRAPSNQDSIRDS